MVKQYLNRAEREGMLKLACATKMAGQIVTDWAAHNNLTSDEGKWLKLGRTYINKAQEAIIKRLGAEEASKILREAAEMEFIFRTKETEDMYQRRIKKEYENQGTFVPSGALDSLAEMALTTCSQCKCSAEEKANCPGRNAFIELDIPVFDSSPPEGVCPYEITE